MTMPYSLITTPNPKIMTRNLYALLVGIDAYPNPIPPLQGCVNDIQSFREYLSAKVNQDNYQLHIKTLLNQDATRQGLIDGFRQHLAQAGSNDVVIFYYAGHGAQEITPPELWTLEPDRLDETLVCYDSRLPGGWDLADKELAQLIAEVGETNPHFLVILDCCHSGSGTRGELDLDVSVRKAPLDRRKRPIHSFLVAPTEVKQLSTSRSLEANMADWTIPQGKHICLSACRDSELAKEYNANGQRRGVFSYFLLDTLTKTNGSLTYRDLLKRTQALVRSKVTAQFPQIHYEEQGFNQPFLGGAIKSAIASQTNYYTVSNYPDYGWVIDGGEVHGIPQPTKDDTTELILFPITASDRQLRQPSAAIGTAKVVEVMPQLSQINISGIDKLKPDTTYKAVVTSLSLPPKTVIVTGESVGIKLARIALYQNFSPYLHEVAQSQPAEFQLLARNNQYLITRPADDRPLVAPLLGYTEATATQAIARLEHITRWTNIAELSSSTNSSIPSDAIQVSIYHDGQELQATDLQLEYRLKNGKWQQPTFKIKLQNNSNQALYCALLDLTDRYAVSAELFPTGGVWLQPGEEAWALNGQAIYSTVDRTLWQKQGITEVKDILKLIVSTVEFDATLLEMSELDLPARDLADLRPKRGQGTLNCLLQKVQSRAFMAIPEAETTNDEWATSQITISTLRPQATKSIPKQGESVDLGFGVKMQSHPSLQAKVRLTTINQSTRDLGDRLLPPILRSEDNSIQPFQFTTSRGNDPGLSALELTEVKNPTTVTKTNPLNLILDTTLAANEQLLPVAYDGEFFLPLGFAYRTAEDKTAIKLERLPQPYSNQLSSHISARDNRSLGGSIRIFLQKIISQKLDQEFKYPLLAVADVDEEENVTYEQNLEKVKQRVAKADKIILYIHGIISDTQDMVKSVRRAKVRLNDQKRSLINLYDLVLTFDYENLHTPIEENARLLKQRLEAVGLGENSGKTLHIVAHSMGGLVSRWFIAKEGGDRFVQHLIMLGTPNAGSPWSKVEDWAVTMLTIGLNSLAEITWPIPVLGALLRLMGTTVSALEIIDISLDQMQPNSQFLNNLAASQEHMVPYSIVAGNTSIIPAALESNGEGASILGRLLHKLFNRTISLPFLGQPNDIAVTVDSIKSINQGKDLQPLIQEVGCDHLTYFIHPESLKALTHAIIHAQHKTDIATDEFPVPAPPLSLKQILIEPATKPTVRAKKSNSTWLIGAIASLLSLLAMISWFFGQKSHQDKPIQGRETNQALVETLSQSTKIIPNGT